MKRQKIAIDGRLIHTGVGRYVRELTARLPTLIPDADFTVYIPTGHAHDIPIAKNLKTKEINIPIFSFAEQFQFLRELRRQNFDLVHFVNYNAPIFYFRPFVMTIHDLTPLNFRGKRHNFFKWLVFKLLLKWNVRRAQKIFTVSEWTKRDLEKHVSALPPIVVTLLGGPENQKTTENPQKITEKYNLPAKFFVSMGNHRIHKNLPRLVRAFAKISPKLPDFHLVLSGKRDPLYPEIHDEVKKLKLTKKVHFLGAVPWDDVFPIISAAQIYVFPSLSEGFGLPMLEAMSLGIPVIASNATSLPEVGGTDAAIYFDPLDETNIADTMFLVANDETLRQKLIQNGKKRVKNFSWDSFAQKTATEYQNSLNSL